LIKADTGALSFLQWKQLFESKASDQVIYCIYISTDNRMGFSVPLVAGNGRETGKWVGEERVSTSDHR
jgi:hypothetical protein